MISLFTRQLGREPHSLHFFYLQNCVCWVNFLIEINLWMGGNIRIRNGPRCKWKVRKYVKMGQTHSLVSVDLTTSFGNSSMDRYWRILSRNGIHKSPISEVQQVHSITILKNDVAAYGSAELKNAGKISKWLGNYASNDKGKFGYSKIYQDDDVRVQLQICSIQICLLYILVRTHARMHAIVYMCATAAAANDFRRSSVVEKRGRT